MDADGAAKPATNPPTVKFKLVVEQPPLITTTSITPSTITGGEPFTFTIAASSSQAATSSIVGGALPPGMT